MSLLIAIAVKSLLIAALTLGLLHLMRNRSAAERSWVAHVGLLALMIIAFAPLALPNWTVEAPGILGQAQAPATSLPAMNVLTATPVIGRVAKMPAAASAPILDSPPPMVLHKAAPRSLDAIAVATVLYALPAAILLFITFLALVRLIALQARAEVLVDGHWLSALARAQRRMGFKHGTALLTSNELASPISWGVMRPVILLNSRAVEATGEAEAIIAHELAHVARLDWLKLLLARVATALFWFNPLVWLLAREAHQLREEAADDTVLAANIADTDYAQLLVGVARHECPGMLLGAHGVAPSNGSLARRVARVLDGKSARGPVARSFAVGVSAGAVLVAAPLAALTLTPAGVKRQAMTTSSVARSEPAIVEEARADVPSLIAGGVKSAVAVTVASAVAQSADGGDPLGLDREAALDAKNAARDAKYRTRDARKAARDAEHQARDALREAERAQRIGADARSQMFGVTPEYVDAMRAAARSLASLQSSRFTALRFVGVTPNYARDLAAAGFPSITAEELMQARTIGLTGDYVRAMRSAGIKGDLDDFVQLRAVGADPALAARVKLSGAKSMNAEDLVELRALGAVRIHNPHRPPTPAAPPRPWNADQDPGG